MVAKKDSLPQQHELETTTLEALASRRLPTTSNKAINEAILLVDDGRSYINVAKEEDEVHIDVRIRTSKQQIIKLIITAILLITAHSAPEHLDLIKTLLLQGGG